CSYWSCPGCRHSRRQGDDPHFRIAAEGVRETPFLVASQNQVASLRLQLPDRASAPTLSGLSPDRAPSDTINEGLPTGQRIPAKGEQSSGWHGLHVDP